LVLEKKKKIKMKNLKVFFVFLLFEVVWMNPEKWYNSKYRYRFRLKPRKVSTFIACCIVSPYHLIRYGIEGVFHLFQHSFNTQGYTTFEFTRDISERKPTIWEAYLKF